MKDPLFKHDCDRCQFVGSAIDSTYSVQSAKCDLYVCMPSEPRLRDLRTPTLIARYSDKASDYRSCDAKSAPRYGIYELIRERAIGARLMDPDRY